MKFKKKTLMLISFTLGTLLVATTALADIMNKSGYDQLKDALKVTAEKSSDEFDSFTMDVSMALKDNGKTLLTENEIRKYDRSKGASENISSRETNGVKNNSQTYSDKTTQIRVSNSDPTYYVTEYTNGRTEEAFSNPFKEGRADDLEKIVDAVVGGLKDNVVVTDNSGGSKGLEGSITEVQIPSLVNALASYQFKQTFNGNQENLPHLTKDIFVKEVKGTAKVDKDGALESILGSAELSGKDDQGAVHDVTVEVLAKLSGVNSTTVTKPDLTGKKVVSNSISNSGFEISNPEKFVGKFKNNILIEKDGKFVKVGERILIIAHFDNKTVAGRYYEEYKPGFEQYANNKLEFTFDAQFEANGNNANFDYLNESGNKVQGGICIDQSAGKIYLNGSMSTAGGVLFDSTFSPDLE